tara:strand:+ start:56 stop:229 length:174 start_codon:yes stop_codon:yes gene_type:complete
MKNILINRASAPSKPNNLNIEEEYWLQLEKEWSDEEIYNNIEESDYDEWCDIKKDKS